LAEIENNLSDQGHQVAKQRTQIESELLYPLARGQDIGRFFVAPPAMAIILPQRGMRAYDEATMRTRFPHALAYFEQYRDTACKGCGVGSTCRKGLVHRSSYANSKYRDAIGEYWGVWNVGEYTFAPYKVAWKEVSSRFEAAVLGTAKLGELDPKPYIPDHKLMFLPCETEDEAHYICGVLNSSMIRSFAEAVSLSTSRGTRIFDELNIPAFDPANPAHLRVAELSKDAHQGKRKIDDEFEDELDLAVADALGQAVPVLGPVTVSTDSLTASLREAVVFGPGLEFPRASELLKDLSLVAIDFETTGLSPELFGDRAVEIAAVKFSLGGISQTWSRTIWPGRPISENARRIHGLSLESLENEPTFADIWDELRDFIGDAILVAHNADFDARVLSAHLGDIGVDSNFLFLDTLQLLRKQFSLPSNRLSDALVALGVEGKVTHSALADAIATAQLALRLYELLSVRAKVETLGDLVTLAGRPPTCIKVQVPAETDPHITLVRNKAEVVVTYKRGKRLMEISGQMDYVVKACKAAYLTLRLKNGKRLLLHLNRAKIRPIHREING
jgi:DNA polymerase III epsilon subunit family exonuclease